MGKFMPKSKNLTDVSLEELSELSSIGVRTRARTLALQRILEMEADSCGLYLQLRSRRLEKRLFYGSPKRRRRRNSEGFGANPNPNSAPNLSGGSSPNLNFKVDSGEKEEENGEDGGHVAIAASLGENMAETESRARISRETTPCNLIRVPDNVRTPRPSTRRASSAWEHNRVARNPTLQQVSATQDMDELFATAEKEQQEEFIKKYNYDPVKDKPLAGRFEWVKLKP